MPEQTSFAVLYKKLLNCNFDPAGNGPRRRWTPCCDSYPKVRPKKLQFRLNRVTICDRIQQLEKEIITS